MVKIAAVEQLKYAVESLLDTNDLLEQFKDADGAVFRATFYLLGFDPLLIERDDGKILVAHLRPLGDGIVLEPAVRLTDEWLPLEFVQQRGGLKREVARVNGEAVTVLDPGGFGNARQFARVWGQGIEMQGWAEDAEVIEDD